jgi:hypothetical protein
MAERRRAAGIRFALPVPLPTIAQLYAEIEREQRAIAEYITCPISRDTIARQDAVLASDGYLYDRHSLVEWAQACLSRQEPLTSPVTRAYLRPWAVWAGTMLDEAGWEAGEECAGASLESEARQDRGSAGRAKVERSESRPQSEPLWLPSLRPPFSPMVVVRKGTQRVGRWDTALGVASRMLLGWDDQDVAEWCFPVEGATIATPPPADQLLPLAQPLLRWLGIPAGEFANPEHILTAWLRVHRPALGGEASAEEPPWQTFEEAFLALAAR